MSSSVYLWFCPGPLVLAYSGCPFIGGGVDRFCVSRPALSGAGSRQHCCRRPSFSRCRDLTGSVLGLSRGCLALFIPLSLRKGSSEQCAPHQRAKHGRRALPEPSLLPCDRDKVFTRKGVEIRENSCWVPHGRASGVVQRTSDGEGRGRRTAASLVPQSGLGLLVLRHLGPLGLTVVMCRDAACT